MPFKRRWTVLIIDRKLKQSNMAGKTVSSCKRTRLTNKNLLCQVACVFTVGLIRQFGNCPRGDISCTFQLISLPQRLPSRIGQAACSVRWSHSASLSMLCQIRAEPLLGCTPRPKAGKEVMPPSCTSVSWKCRAEEESTKTGVSKVLPRNMRFKPSTYVEQNGSNAIIPDVSLVGCLPKRSIYIHKYRTSISGCSTMMSSTWGLDKSGSA